jgi:hypothetical protein
MDEIHLGELTVADVKRVVLHRTDPVAAEAVTVVSETDRRPVAGDSDRSGRDTFRAPIGNSYTGWQALR